MDDPALAPAIHQQALVGLRRINRLSRTAAVLWRPLRDFARSAKRPLRVLDVASGGGDVAIDLARRAQRAGLPIEISGCDISPVAVRLATENARRAGLTLEFFAFDALRGAWPDRVDVVTCSLFLHHLDEDDVVALLRNMADAAGALLLVDDLRRCRLGLLAAFAIPRIVTRCDVVHDDAVRSVRAAFTTDELIDLGGRAGLRGATVTPHFPWRQLLAFRK